jgi:hypothetical protein
MRLTIKISKAIAVSIILFCCFLPSARSQVVATAAQKAKALYITPVKIAASEARREENASESPDKLVVPVDLKYTINGPEKVEYGSKQTYNVLPRAPQNGWWYISCGTPIEYFDDYISIQFNVTACSSCDIMLFDNNDYLLGYLKVYISGNTFPLSAGRILTGSQSLKKDSIAGDLMTTPAEGGNCGSNFQYQWQYSYNDGLFWNIEDAGTNTNLVFEGPHNRDIWFRRRVICGTDTLFTGSVAVLMIRPLSSGTIGNWPKTIPPATSPGTISATTPQSGECNGNYTFQWQTSNDGNTFNDIAGATTANLTNAPVINQQTFIRRKTICNNETAFTNVAIIKMNAAFAPATPMNEIDSMLAIGGDNVYALLNIPNDSIANNRTPATAPFYNLDEDQALTQQSFQINNGYAGLSNTEISILDTLPAQDNIPARITDSTNPQRDMMTAFIPFLDETLVQQYLVIQNYTGMDSVVRMADMIPFETAMQPIEAARQNQLPEQQRNYIPTSLFSQFTQSAVINGTGIVVRNQVYHYTAIFHFPFAPSSSIIWNAYGGTIVAQNNNPANGPLFADIKWTSFIAAPYFGCRLRHVPVWGTPGLLYC